MNDKSFSTYLLAWAKNLMGINYLGGKCTKCGNDDPVVLEFHHEKYKNFNIDTNCRWSRIQEELDNCILFCSNCHAEHHGKNTRNGKNKNNLLLNLDISKCSKCNYSGENYASLHFHHLDPKNKKFNISKFTCRQIKNLTLEDLYNEIKKCILICDNCHKKEHYSVNFDKNKNLIYDKVKKYKEQREPIGDDIIKDMLLNGMKQHEVCIKLNLPKSTVSTINKRLLNSGVRLPDQEIMVKDKELKCQYCNETFFSKKTNVKYCSKKCASLNRGKIPSKEILENLCKEKSSREVGKILGVSNVAVWKWKKLYNL